jgi:hypothetical protein
MEWAASTPNATSGRNSYFTNTASGSSYSGTSTPLSGSFSGQQQSYLPSTPGPYSSHGSHGVGYHQPQLDIQLDNDEVILRGAGSDYDPGLLSGRVVLNLLESANIREITMRLEGKAKVVFYEGGT